MAGKKKGIKEKSAGTSSRKRTPVRKKSAAEEELKNAPVDETEDDGAEGSEDQEVEVLVDSETDDDSEDEGNAKTALAPISSGPARQLDPFSRYMAEISRHELLSREEEIELATRYIDEGDIEAAYRLVTANLRLVVKIAMEYRRSYTNILDLIQEGNIGLMQAVKKFDPFRGVKLSSYAAWWIRAYIIRYMLNNLRMVKIGTTEAQRKLFFNLNKEKEKIEAEGLDISPKLLADRLEVTERDVIEMDQMLSRRDLSLDAPVDDESDSNLMNVLPSKGATIEDEYADSEMLVLFREKIKEFSNQLNDKEMVILSDRLLSDSPKTLEEIGNEFGISRERVRQLESRIRVKLKEYITSTTPDFDAGLD